MLSESSLSFEVSLALDILGYKPAMIRWRRHCYSTISDFVLQWTAEAPTSLQGLSLKPYLIGSKVEGTTVLYQSDEDYMLVCDCFLCANIFEPPEQGIGKLWVKLLEHVDPGYVLLQRAWDKDLVDGPGLKAFLEKFMVRYSDDREYISSKKLNRRILAAYNDLYEAALQDSSISDSVKNFIRVKPAEAQPEGSNYKLKVKNSHFTFDFVFAFPCVNMAFMKRWAKRERKHGWPTADKIWRVTHMCCAYVVPKGSKNSADGCFEFRICHTFGEIELIKSLNETQIKVYVLLKELFKSEFEPKFPDMITSYVLKNVIFWLCERTPAKLYQTGFLLERFMEALIYIQSLVSNDAFMPNYFIPERNLLEGSINVGRQSEVNSLLSDWISEGENIVFKITPLHREVLHVKHDIIQAILTIFFRNLCEIHFLKVRRSSLEHGQIAKQAVWYLTDAAYKYIEQHCFDTTAK